MTRREALSIIAKGGLAALLIGGAGAAFQLARHEINRAGRWMPREADRIEGAMQELRIALRDPDQMRSMRAVYQLRALTGSESDWRLAVGRAMSLAGTDTVPTRRIELHDVSGCLIGAGVG
jgi:hypothetical protein